MIELPTSISPPTLAQPGSYGLWHVDVMRRGRGESPRRGLSLPFAPPPLLTLPPLEHWRPTATPSLRRRLGGPSWKKGSPSPSSDGRPHKSPTLTPMHT